MSGFKHKPIVAHEGVGVAFVQAMLCCIAVTRTVVESSADMQDHQLQHTRQLQFAQPIYTRWLDCELNASEIRQM